MNATKATPGTRAAPASPDSASDTGRIEEILRDVDLRPGNKTAQNALNAAVAEVAAQVSKRGWVPTPADKNSLGEFTRQAQGVSLEAKDYFESKQTRFDTLKAEVAELKRKKNKSEEDKRHLKSLEQELKGVENDLKKNGRTAKKEMVNAGTVYHRMHEQFQYALQRVGDQGDLGRTREEWESEFAQANTERAFADVLKGLRRETSSQQESLNEPRAHYLETIRVDDEDIADIFRHVPLDAEGKAAAVAGLRELEPAVVEGLHQDNLFAVKDRELQQRIGARLAGANGPYADNLKQMQKLHALGQRVDAASEPLKFHLKEVESGAGRISDLLDGFERTDRQIRQLVERLVRAKRDVGPARDSERNAKAQVSLKQAAVDAILNSEAYKNTPDPQKPRYRPLLQAKWDLQVATKALNEASERVNGNEGFVRNLPRQIDSSERELRELRRNYEFDSRRLGHSLDDARRAMPPYADQMAAENRKPEVPGLLLRDRFPVDLPNHWEWDGRETYWHGFEWDRRDGNWWHHWPELSVHQERARIGELARRYRSVTDVVDSNRTIPVHESNRLSSANSQMLNDEYDKLME